MSCLYCFPTPDSLTDMSVGFGLGDPSITFITKFRWMFTIKGITGAINAVPPLKGGRPNFGFKEMEIKHLTETVFYPVRPEWRPITLVLYDTRPSGGSRSYDVNPIFTWIRQVYDTTNNGKWSPVFDGNPGNSQNFMRQGSLVMYDGCGEPLQQVIFDDCWPKDVNWGEVDMGSSEILTVEVQLRYARATFCDMAQTQFP